MPQAPIPVPQVSAPQAIPMPQVSAPQAPIPMPQVSAPQAVIPMPQVSVPQAAIPVPQVSVPQAAIPVPQAAVPVPQAIAKPNIPTLTGTSAAAPVLTTLTPDQLTQQLQGISISGFVPPPSTIDSDLSDLLVATAQERPETYEARRRLTERIATIPDYPLNPVTAVTVGHMLMAKSTLNVEYDRDVESSLTQIMALLER